MPERDHAGVADEDVERDDDRHRHECSAELVRESGVDEAHAAHESDEDEHQDRAEQLHELHDSPHTRSTAVRATADEETLQAQEKDDDHEHEHGRIEVDAARKRPGAAARQEA